MNYNRAVIVGRVTDNLTLRTTPDGQSVTSMGVATNRMWTDKQGVSHESTEFHNVVIWGKTAETASMYLQKGSLVLVEGRLETRSWEDKSGVTRRVTEIRAESVQFGPRPNAAQRAAPSTAPARTVTTDDDIPVIHLDGDEEDTGRNMEPFPF